MMCVMPGETCCLWRRIVAQQPEAGSARSAAERLCATYWFNMDSPHRENIHILLQKGRDAGAGRHGEARGRGHELQCRWKSLPSQPCVSDFQGAPAVADAGAGRHGAARGRGRGRRRQLRHAVGRFGTPGGWAPRRAARAARPHAPRCACLLAVALLGGCWVLARELGACCWPAPSWTTFKCFRQAGFVWDALQQTCLRYLVTLVWCNLCWGHGTNSHACLM